MWLEGDELVYLLETHHQGIEPKECSNIEKHWPCQLLLGNCFWRKGFEAAFGPDRMGEKGGCSRIARLLAHPNPDAVLVMGRAGENIIS